MSLLAVDMGSSSCKAVAFSEAGEVLAEKNYPYSPESPRPSWVEMDADRFWKALQTVASALARDLTRDPPRALSISSHGETFVPVNAYQQPVASAILNMDNRAVTQANRLRDALGQNRLFEVTGLIVHPMYPIPKILWLRENLQPIFQSAARFLSVTDYLLTRMGLPAYIDYSLASRFLAFDIRQQCWSEEILAACDLAPQRFAEPVPAGTVAGQLSSEAARDLGLPRGTLVVVGGHDQPCAALGLGVLAPGRVSASLGTYECLLVASEKPATNKAALSANLNSYCHVVPNRFVTIAYFPSGIMVDWFLRLLYADRLQSNSASVDNLCSLLEAEAPAAPTGLLIAPHLLGTCNPDFNPHATGVIAGLRPATDPSVIYKGILEGIACEFLLMVQLLERAVGPFRDVYLTGGGCRSKLGVKLRAALSGRRLHLMRCPEAVCLGTAILAGVAAGTYRGFSEAVDQVVQVAETVDPELELAKIYAAQLQQYRQLYSSLASLRAAQASLSS